MTIENNTLSKKEHKLNLRVDSLTKIFPHPSMKDINYPLFANSSFSIDAEKINFIVGPSGSGKSTLLRILMGIEAIDAGEVFFEDKRINTMEQHEKQAYLRTVGYMDQFPEKFLFMKQTVSKNLAYSLKLYKLKLKRKETKEKIRELSSSLGLEESLKKPLAVLSGGELRRVAFACATISSPKILLCDEPSAHLDQKSKQELIGLFQKFSKEKKMLIFVATHDQGILDHGRVYTITNRRIELNE